MSQSHRSEDSSNNSSSSRSGKNGGISLQPLCALDDVNYFPSDGGPAVNGRLAYTQDRQLVFSSPAGGEEISFPLQLLLEFELLAKSGASVPTASLSADNGSSANLQSRLGLSVRLKTSQAAFTFDGPGRCSETAGQLVTLVAAERRRLPSNLQQLCDSLQQGLALSASSVATGAAGLYRFSLEAEFIRLGAVNNANWRLWTANEEYGVCDTYPTLLYVPATVPDQVLLDCAKFRSRSRLPVLTYLYEPRQSALCRCSQPLAGLNARSSSDEQVVQAILDANPNLTASPADGGARRLYIVDTRPMANAIGNRAMGKGYELAVNYRNTEINFCQIENIHVMRDSQRQLAHAACQLKPAQQSSEGQATAHAWTGAVNKSGWLKHLRAILLAAQSIADHLLDGASVLVHCSDGWDRTAQTAALAQLLIDPHYRTLHGFQDLIEKEWLSFGHKFADRCAHFGWSDEASPVFSQFADCVHQLGRLFPTRFEFNEAYLLALVDAAYSCKFATFLGNCDRERRTSQALGSLQLPCFWTQALERRAEFLNPLYTPTPPSLSDPIRVGPLPRCLLRVWQGLQNPWRRQGSQGWASRYNSSSGSTSRQRGEHVVTCDEATLTRRLARSAERIARLEELEKCLLRARQLSEMPPSGGASAAAAAGWELESGQLVCGYCGLPHYHLLRHRANCHSCGRLACGSCLKSLVIDQQQQQQAVGQLTQLCPACSSGHLAGGPSPHAMASSKLMMSA